MNYHQCGPQKTDYRIGRECSFCRQHPDSPFLPKRDLQVHAKSEDIASAHITEDGYVRHRMLEIRKLIERRNSDAIAA